jgi:hypothetical protein
MSLPVATALQPYRAAVRLLTASGLALAFSLPLQVFADDIAVAVKNPAVVAVTLPEISIWVRAAPLRLVISQLAGMTGRQPELDGSLDKPVSGRFSGSLEETLALLSADYPVLFDMDREVLRATDSQSISQASIPLTGKVLDDALRVQLQGSLLPGNEVEFQEDAIRLVGHPDFVKRTASQIIRSLSDGDREQREGDADSYADPVAEVAASSDIIAPDDQPIADAGGTEMLSDIEDKTRPSPEQATLSRPIRWVTDIPGYTTF